MNSKRFITAITILTTLFVFAGTQQAEAQLLKKLKKKAEDAATKKLEDKTVKETNKVMDTLLNNDGKNGNGNNGTTGNGQGAVDKGEGQVLSMTEKEEISMYSKSDWVPGENLILFDDFSDDPVGDFPQLWDTNSSGEIVTLSVAPDVKWLKMYNYTMYQPDLPKELPKDFTVEFDVVAYGVEKGKTSQTARFNIHLGDGKQKLKEGSSYAYIYLPVFQGWLKPVYFKSAKANVQLASGNISKDVRTAFLEGCHVALSVKDTRYRLYVNGDKIVDFPRAVPPDENIKTLLFSSYGMNDNNEHILITNLRIAEGLPEPRAKLFATGKYVTNAILFDVNSATIKPESYGILREIAEAMKTESNKKIKIVGHTDSDGTEEYNMQLSQKRAASVKEALVNNFGIPADRLSTEGKGESEPVAPNTTISEKAKNRRTEFIVL